MVREGMGMMRFVCRRWAPEILIKLRTEGARQRRFNELLFGIEGISDRVLTDRLREMADVGLVDRWVGDGLGVKVYYRLTPLGHEVADHLVPLALMSPPLKVRQEAAV
jgi:DNA-binding HxlR family transcriptional regulator